MTALMRAAGFQNKKEEGALSEGKQKGGKNASPSAPFERRKKRPRCARNPFHPLKKKEEAFRRGGAVGRGGRQ